MKPFQKSSCCALFFSLYLHTYIYFDNCKGIYASASFFLVCTCDRAQKPSSSTSDVVSLGQPKSGRCILHSSAFVTRVRVQRVSESRGEMGGSAPFFLFTYTHICTYICTYKYTYEYVHTYICMCVWANTQLDWFMHANALRGKKQEQQNQNKRFQEDNKKSSSAAWRLHRLFYIFHRRLLLYLPGI